ncbi:hypothetical protein LX36DRAFT_392783 [Colletotrichum falcatum]|nr:hypothetical protein LX36DRAFT_392783 [Colletotrichum falcatum]
MARMRTMCDARKPSDCWFGNHRMARHCDAFLNPAAMTTLHMCEGCCEDGGGQCPMEGGGGAIITLGGGCAVLGWWMGYLTIGR